MADEEIQPTTKVMRIVFICLLLITVIVGGLSTLFGMQSSGSLERQSEEQNEESPFE